MAKKLVLQFLCSFLFASSLFGSERVTVSRVIDGDTIETAQGVKVRLVGINAPEIQDLFGEEAKQHLRSLIEGRAVELIRDNTSSDRDRYDRLLRYVILDGNDVNRQMVEDGFAFAYLKFRFDKSVEYLTAEKQAKSLAVGIWSREGTPGGVEQNRDLRPHIFRVYIVAGLVLFLLAFGIYFYNRR